MAKEMTQEEKIKAIRDFIERGRQIAKKMDTKTSFNPSKTYALVRN